MSLSPAFLPVCWYQTRATFLASLRRRGLKSESISVSGEIVRLQFAGASFSSLTEWINESRAAFQLAVSEATVTAQPTPDIVNASLVLRQQKAQ